MSDNSCKNCGKVFKTERRLATHMEKKICDKNVNISKFQCDICGLRYKKKSALNRHKRKKHMDEVSDNVVCSLCNEVFETEDQVRYHLMNTCEEMNKTIRQNGQNIVTNNTNNIVRNRNIDIDINIVPEDFDKPQSEITQDDMLKVIGDKLKHLMDLLKQGNLDEIENSGVYRISASETVEHK